MLESELSYIGDRHHSTLIACSIQNSLILWTGTTRYPSHARSRTQLTAADEVQQMKFSEVTRMSIGTPKFWENIACTDTITRLHTYARTRATSRNSNSLTRRLNYATRAANNNESQPARQSTLTYTKSSHQASN